MASITQNIQGVGDSSGLASASRGVKAPEPKGAVADKSQAYSIAAKSASDSNSGLATLIGGAGDLLSSAVKAVDQSYKIGIDDQVTQMTDQVFDEMGVNDVTTIEGNALIEEPLPEEINRAEKNITRLTSAKSRGVLSENAYWARMNSITRQLRSRYPGYRDYIDEKVSSIAGGKPANQIARNLMQQAADAAKNSNAEETKYMALVEEYAGKGVLPPDWQKYTTRTELINAVSPVLRRKAQVDMMKSEIDLRKSKNEAVGDLVKESARTFVHNETVTALTNINSGMGKNYSEIMSTIDQLAVQKGPLSPEQDQALRSQFLQFKQQFINKTKAGLLEIYGADLNPTQIDEAMAPAMGVIQGMEDALVNKNIGLLKMNADRLEAMKTSDDITLYNTSPELRLQGALTRATSPQVSELYMTLSPKLQTTRDKTLFGDSLARSFGIETSLKEEINSLAQKGAPTVGKQVLQAHIDTMMDPNAKPEAFIKIAENLYGPRNQGFLSAIKPEERGIILNRLASPTIQARMKQMADAGRPELYENYKGWLEDATATMIKKSVDNLNATSGKAIVSFNEKTATFEVKHDPRVGVRGAGPYGSAKTAVDNLNASLRSLKPLYDAEGRDINQFLRDVFDASGVRPGSTLESFKNAIPLTIKGTQGTDSARGGAGTDRLTPEQKARAQEVKNFPPDPRFPIFNTDAALDNLKPRYDLATENLKLYEQMARENPEDPAVLDQLEKAFTEYRKINDEYNNIVAQRIKKMPTLLRGSVND